MDTLKLIQEDTDCIIDRFGDGYGLESDQQIKLTKERIPKIYLSQRDDEGINSGKADVQASIENGLLTEGAPTDVFWRPPQK